MLCSLYKAHPKKWLWQFLNVILECKYHGRWSFHVYPPGCQGLFTLKHNSSFDHVTLDMRASLRRSVKTFLIQLMTWLTLRVWRKELLIALIRTILSSSKKMIPQIDGSAYDLFSIPCAGTTEKSFKIEMRSDFDMS